MLRKHYTVPFACLLAAACASPPPVGPDRPPHVLEIELARFQEIQRQFTQANVGTHTFDFEGHGRVTVREITLDGFPGNAYLRCRFHFQNRTDKPIVQTWVSLDVIDSRGRVVSTQSCHCIVPVPIPIARGSYYSDELRTPTYGAHLQDGWSWRIRCVSDLETEDEPLDPPVERGGGWQSAPVIIKDRSGRHH